MPRMKTDVIGLITGAAMNLKRKHGGEAYALLEVANNLRLLMRGEATIYEWNDCYVGADREPLDIDTMLPAPRP